MPEPRLRPLVQRFGAMLLEIPVFSGVYGVIWKWGDSWGLADVFFWAIEEIAIESMVDDEVRRHAFVASLATHLDDAPRLEADHRQHVQNDPVFPRTVNKREILRPWCSGTAQCHWV
jgi:hypothetical protein